MGCFPTEFQRDAAHRRDMKHGGRLPYSPSARRFGVMAGPSRWSDYRIAVGSVQWGVSPVVLLATRFCLNHLLGERMLRRVDVSPIAEFGGKVSLRQRQHPVTPHRQTRGEGHRAFFVRQKQAKGTKEGWGRGKKMEGRRMKGGNCGLRGRAWAILIPSIPSVSIISVLDIAAGMGF